MVYDSFFKFFIKALYSSISDKKELIDFIANALHIEKRAATRRLQGDYQFRISEVLELCLLLNISFDNMLQQNGAQYDHPISYVHLPFANFTQKEYQHVCLLLDKLDALSKEKGSYILLSSNILPDFFYLKHDFLIRLFKMKSDYIRDEPDAKNCIDIENVIKSAHFEVISRYVEIVYQFKRIIIVWDPRIIPNVISDIEYFTSIGYLTQQHRKHLKQELFLLIDHIDHLCEECSSPGNINDFTFAISSAYMRKVNSIFSGNDNKVAVDSTYYSTYLYTKEPDLMESIEHSILNALKSSVIISNSNEREKLKFIKTQKSLISKI